MLRKLPRVVYFFKTVITVILIVIISEVSKRSTFVGALLASIPLISVLAMIWLYVDTKDITKVSNLSTSVFWLVLPSLVLFIILPILLKHGVNFYLSMGISIVATAGCYKLMISALTHYGVKF